MNHWILSLLFLLLPTAIRIECEIAICISERMCAVSVIKPKYWDIVRDCSQKYNLDPYLVYGIIQSESSEMPDAMRYERNFHRWLMMRKPELTFVESCPRSFSYGLMQILGQTAIETGFSDRPWDDLFIPEVNINLGCKFLRSLLDNLDGDTQLAIAGYNAGLGSALSAMKEKRSPLNMEYVRKVLSWKGKMEYLFPELA